MTLGLQSCHWLSLLHVLVNNRQLEDVNAVDDTIAAADAGSFCLNVNQATAGSPHWHIIDQWLLRLFHRMCCLHINEWLETESCKCHASRGKLVLKHYAAVRNKLSSSQGLQSMSLFEYCTVWHRRVYVPGHSSSSSSSTYKSRDLRHCLLYTHGVAKQHDNRGALVNISFNHLRRLYRTHNPGSE